MKMFIMARSILHMGPDDPSNGKGHFHFFKMAFTSLSKTTSQLEHIPNGKYVLRNPFWPLDSSFLMRKSEKKRAKLFRSAWPDFKTYIL